MRLKLPQPLEFETHVSIADALRLAVVPGWLWTHFPAGEKRDMRTAARLKRMGLNRGFADFLLIDPEGLHHWLELKRGKAPLTSDQEAFGEAMRARRVPYAVVRSFEEAVDQLHEWQALRAEVIL
jgi:hypothetical protein